MNVVKAAFTVGLFTLLSRFIGFLRECSMAFVLGAGLHADAIIIALKISNTLRRVFAEGAFNASFLPRFSKCYNNDGHDSANDLLSDIFSFLIILLSILTLIVLVYFPNILKFLVSGFDETSFKFLLTVDLGRICFIYLLFICVTSLLGGVLNSIDKFAIPAAVYSFLSVFTTSALLLGHFCGFDKTTISYITASFVVLSGIFQVLCLYYILQKHKFKIVFRLKCASEKVIDILKNMLPGIIGAGVWQINLLVDTVISSYLPTGTITCINLADRINQFPLGTLGVALSTALLPILSKCIAKQDYHKAALEIQRGVLFAFFLTFFATALLTALPEESVAVAFQRGQFGYEQVQITSFAMIGFSIGLPAYVLTKVFSSIFFANGDTKTPVIYGIISVLINIVCLIILVPFLKYFGLALCTSISAISNAIMLVLGSKKILRTNMKRSFWLKIMAQLMSAMVTFFSLKYISSAMWSPALGDKGIKWAIYFSFLGVAVMIFFTCTIVVLRIFKERQWKLWKKSSW